MTTTTFPAFADPTVPFVAPTPSSVRGTTSDSKDSRSASALARPRH